MRLEEGRVSNEHGMQERGNGKRGVLNPFVSCVEQLVFAGDFLVSQNQRCLLSDKESDRLTYTSSLGVTLGRGLSVEFCFKS